MNRTGGRVYDFSWNRGNLAALAVLCATALSLLIWQGRSREIFMGREIPVFPDKVELATERIDPNTASAASMRRLPGIGPRTAAEIVRFRQEHPGRNFHSEDDLSQVKGIGPVTVRRIGPFLKIRSPE